METLVVSSQDPRASAFCQRTVETFTFIIHTIYHVFLVARV